MEIGFISEICSIILVFFLFFIFIPRYLEMLGQSAAFCYVIGIFLIVGIIALIWVVEVKG